MITGVFFNYFVTRRFVFDSPVQKHTFIYYVISYGLLYLFSLVLSWFLIDILAYHHTGQDSSLFPQMHWYLIVVEIYSFSLNSNRFILL